MCHAIYYIPTCECREPIYLPEDIEICANRPVSANNRDPLEALECPFVTTECGGMAPGEWCDKCYAWMDEEPDE